MFCLNITEKMKCEKCDKEFDSEVALEHHNKAKHGEVFKKSRWENLNKKKIRNLSFSFIVVLLIGFSGFFIFDKSQNVDILAVNLLSHDNVALHIHPILEIEILGENFPIPSNTGITDGIMKVVHTHDSSGTLHVEPPIPYELRLTHFFQLWSRTFNSQCIFDNCVDSEHELLFYVNGELNNEYENLLLKDHDEIKIVYREK
tara:strand:- start:3006 stop:3611 length:606 start_codon:yes stop_codon:yes gene_type:complete